MKLWRIRARVEIWGLRLVCLVRGHQWESTDTAVDDAGRIDRLHQCRRCFKQRREQTDS